MIQMFFSLVLPVLSTIVLLIWFKKQTSWWEYFIPYLAVGIFIGMFYWIGVDSVTKDTEYVGNYVTEVRYYEPWNDYIHVDPPLWSIITCWIISLISCIGLIIWIINNELTAEDDYYRSRW